MPRIVFRTVRGIFFVYMFVSFYCNLFHIVLYLTHVIECEDTEASRYMAEMRFTDEQQLFLDKAADGLDVLVDACIGSGKTTAIQAACGLLHGKGKKVLYLTYNRRLLEEARKRIDPHDADVHTFHSFGGSMLNQAGVGAGSEREVPYQFNHRLKKVYRYDAVVVDEYQDLSEDLKDMLWHIVRMSLNNYNFAPQFLIVGDRDQKIIDNTEIDAPACVRELMAFLSMVHGREYSELQFTNCFRLSAEYASQIGQAWGKSIIGLNPSCEVRQMDVLKCAMFLSQFEPKDILVLGNNMSWGKRVELQNILETRWPEKFNKDTVYSSITDREGDRRGLDTSECAVFTTFDSAKGMERRACVICNYDPGYLNARMKHQTSRAVLKNLFLVAASRGKNHNIILADRGTDVLTFDAIARISGSPDIDMRPEYVSEMFDFKLKENVDRCLALVETETLQEEGRAIKAVSTSGQIDLSICAGIHAQAAYFSGYDIQAEITRAWNERCSKGNFPKLPLPKKDWPLWKNVLYLAALETGQERYVKQVKEPYMGDASTQELCDRLAERLDKSDLAECPCMVLFKDCKDTSKGVVVGDKMARGRADVMKDGIPWELKFTGALKAEHILQAAMYCVASTAPYAVLWNLRTDELLKVTVPDASAFLSEALSCVSRRRLNAGTASVAMFGSKEPEPVRIDM